MANRGASFREAIASENRLRADRAVLLDACKKVMEMLFDWQDPEQTAKERAILAEAIELTEGR